MKNRGNSENQPALVNNFLFTKTIHSCIKFCTSISRKDLKRIEIISLSSFAIFSTFLYSFINWQKHVHFQTFGWDTSVFDQQVYLASILKSPYSSLMKMNGLGDHFHPLVLIAGGLLYRIWADPRMLFILQSSIVSLSTIPLYLLARHVLTRTKIPSFGVFSISFGLVILYLFSVAFQAMVLDEFHDDVLVTLPLMWMMYFLVKQNSKWYWISFILVLLTKEEYGLFGIPLALYIFLTTKEIKKALLTALLGIGVFYLLLFHIMPFFAGSTKYAHFLTENKPSFIIQKFIRNPNRLITELVNHPAKQKTINTSLVSYGFLPLLSPINLILPTASLAIRFYDQTTPRRYEFNNHYASPFIPFFAIAAVFGLYNMILFFEKRHWIDPKTFWILLTATLLFLAVHQDLALHGPVNSIFKKSFYKTQAWEYNANELIKQVPANVVIATQNSLLPHLSQREKFYLLPEVGDAEFIAVDLHDGPNKFAPLSVNKTKMLINELIAKNSYEIVWQKNKAILLKKI